MKAKVFNNFWLKILSVLAAVVLWLIVLNIDNPVTSKPFRGVKVNLVNTEALTSQNQTYRIEEGTDTVDLTVYARRRFLNSIKASDFEVTADMQKDLRYDSMVKIEVKYNGSYTLDRIEKSRENVLVSIEEAVTEQFKVSVETRGKPGNGLAEGPSVPEQSMIEITGPVSVVERIKRVVAEVDITGITGTAVRTCSLKLTNSDGYEIDGTYLQYYGKNQEFEVTVSTLTPKLVGISFDISEAAPEGYGLTGITYKPETVTIAGVKSELASISNLDIPASVLNPERQTGTVEQTVDISQYLPEGMKIPDEDEREIVVTMQIEPFQQASYVLMPSQIQYNNVSEGLEVDLSAMEPLSYTVQGLPNELESLRLEQYQPYVDLSAYTRQGTYQLPLMILKDETSTETEYTVQVRLVRSGTDR